MLKFEVITLFPNLFHENIKTYPLNKAADLNIIKVNLHNLRDHAVDNRGSVDDKTYGGGPGMVLRPEPIFDSVENIKKERNSKIVLLSPTGQEYNQKKAEEYSTLDQLILICGRYEGVDARVKEKLVDESISVGNYILSGGELAAQVVIESVTRLLPGVLEKVGAKENESFVKGLLEYPQYTRPEDYKGMKVPEVLLSGNHKEIEEWREKNKTKMKT